jgi:hypothetical protein
MCFQDVITFICHGQNFGDGAGGRGKKGGRLDGAARGGEKYVNTLVRMMATR